VSARGRGVATGFVAAFAFAAAACGGPPAKGAEQGEVSAPSTPDPVATPAEPLRKGPVYAAPFSADEIRAATKAGRTYRFRVEVPGKKPRERVLTFTKVDESGAEIFSGSGEPKRVGWPTLQRHSEWPKDKVKTREETVKLPAGKFDCMVYEVRDDDGEVSTYYFARTLPGAPVLFYTEQDGKRTKTTTLLQHIPGRGPS
jgi:hypothetical protein